MTKRAKRILEVVSVMEILEKKSAICQLEMFFLGLSEHRDFKNTMLESYASEIAKTLGNAAAISMTLVEGLQCLERKKEQENEND